MKERKTDAPESKTETETATDTDVLDVAPSDRAAVCSKVIDKYAKWSFGIGVIPVPVFDLVALTGVQMKMLSEIAEVYGLKFSDNRIRSILSALLGGAFPQSVGRVGISSLLKSIPVFGTAVSVLTMPVFSSAATYAVGAVFVKHFESGGTLVNIDVASMTEQVKDIAAKYKKDKSEAEVAKAA